MTCNNCGKEINSATIVCPWCGNAVSGTMNENRNPVVSEYPEGIQSSPQKKKGRKIKFLIITVISVIMIAVAIVILISDGDKSSLDEPVTQTEVSETEMITEKSNSKAAEFYLSLKTGGEEFDFELSERSVAALNEYEKYFPCDTKEVSAMKDIADKHSYAELTKSIAKYDASIHAFNGFYVLEIEESEDGDRTYIHFVDEDINSFVGLYMGTLPDIFENDYVNFYGIPLDKIYFENLDGGTTNAIFVAISHCELNQSEVSPEPEVNIQTGNEEPDIVESLMNNPISYFEQQDIAIYGTVFIPYYYEVATETGSPLRLRKLWSAESDVVTMLDNGAALYWYGSYNGWAYVGTTDGLYEGWVDERYIVPENFD